MEPKGRSNTSIEVAHFIVDLSKGSYEEFVKFFFTFHDPTTKNYQGRKFEGEEYASYIFTHNNKQKKIAEKIKAKV